MVKAVVFKPISQNIPQAKTETPSGIPNGQIEQVTINYSTTGANGNIDIYTVPSGKTLIIQSANFIISLQGAMPLGGEGKLYIKGLATKNLIHYYAGLHLTEDICSVTYPKGVYILSGETLGMYNASAGTFTTTQIQGVLVDNSLKDYIIKKSYGF